MDIGPAGEVFAEGCTAAELTRRVADAAGVPAQQVRCRVAAARSRVGTWSGPGPTARGPSRTAARSGATDLLRRAGGVPADADVRVVRRNVARGAPAETFRVDLAAVRRATPGPT